MDSFLQQTARSIIDTLDWSRLSRTTLVLPSHRAGLVLKEEILRLQQERQAPVVWAPQVQTLTQLQDALSPLYAEDELFTIIRLYKLYKAVSCQSSELAPMPLDMFYGWGRQMIADFTNIDASMGAEEVPNFFANSIAAHELSEWRLEPEVEERLRALMKGERLQERGEKDSIRAQYELIWQQLYELYTSLQAEMEAENKGYAGMRQRAVITHWEEDSIQKQIAGRTYVFVGFNYLLPVERDLMMRLRDAGQALFFWDYVPDFHTNEKAFSFAQLNSGILGNNGERRAMSDKKKAVTVVSCSSKEAQAQFVHRWLLDNYTEKGQKVGVVICDETMLESVIYAIPAVTVSGEEEVQPVNITKGFPLRNTAVYARVLTWLNDTGRGKADEVIYPDIIDRMLADLFPANEENPEPETENQALDWQELLILESDYQVRKIANQMRQLIAAGLGDEPFTLKMLRLLIRRTMDSVTMPFHGEPVTDIQIMGVLETRMLDFDRLLLLHVEEGVIPQRQTDCSFIPYYLRKAYHMQTSDERATVYAYNFFRLLSRAGHSTLLYTTAETAEGGKGMSRFIMQMIYSPEFEITKMNLQESSVLSPRSDNRVPGTHASILSSLEKDERGILRRPNGKRYRLSPSALNTYISCPYSFFLQYILDINPGDKEDALFATNTMGTFVHYTMEFIYRTYLHCSGTEPCTVTPEAIEAVRTDEVKMQAALMAAYEKMREEDGMTYLPEHHAAENVVILGYVNNILERDREDAKKGLQICLLEQDRVFPVRIDGAGEILTGGKIDRLDILGTKGQECLRVVDYKSGGYNDKTHAQKMSASWEEMMESEDKSYVRQTLIYSHAVMTHDTTGLPIEPHLYFCRRKLTDIVTTLDVDNATVHDYKPLKAKFLETLQAKIKQVLEATEFPQCEPDKCPSYCPFFEHCGRQPKEY